MQTSETLSIRRYRASDKDAVYALHKLALQSKGIWVDKPKDSSAWPREWSDKDLDNIEDVYLKDGEFLVGEIKGKIVAMGAIRKKEDGVCELKRMRVDPDLQRKGYGQVILTLLEKRAKELGYKKIILDTTIKQVAAQKMYEKNGYVKTGSIKVEQFDTELLFYAKDIR